MSTLEIPPVGKIYDATKGSWLDTSDGNFKSGEYERDKGVVDNSNKAAEAVKDMKDGGGLEDIITLRQALFPLWAFADIHEARWCKKNYWSFIGTHYPAGIISGKEKEYKEALHKLESGEFITSQQKLFPSRKMGWGNAETPSKAFRSALAMCGYITGKGA